MTIALCKSPKQTHFHGHGDVSSQNNPGSGSELQRRGGRKNLPRTAHVGAQMRAKRELRSHVNAASDLSKILAEAPYPLDRDDAAAVAAGADHYVVTSLATTCPFGWRPRRDLF